MTSNPDTELAIFFSVEVKIVKSEDCLKKE